MNTVTPDVLVPLRPVRAVRATLIAWHDAIRSLPVSAWKWAGLIGLFGTTLQCALLLSEAQPSVPLSALLPVLGEAPICWGVQVTLGLCAWAIVDRSGVATERRAGRLAIALTVAVLLQAILSPFLVSLLVGRVDPCVLNGCEGKDWSKVPGWLMDAEGSGHMLMFGALVFAWLEANRRNREVEQRLQASQQERARLKRSAFDARLTAMRAQVDPQFLFESLADVQASYAVDTVKGASTLDLLIAYLRTALPRLRTEGSTIGAEAELVDAWLAVLAARRDGLPARHVDVDPDCLQSPFPATVLLPLVQWAAGDGGQAGSEVVWLRARRLRQMGTGRLMLQLSTAPGRPCWDDEPEPRRIRERLQAMYGEAASLTCRREALRDGALGKSGATATVITLFWPDESADRNRC
jgi:hypothetical protein